MVHSEDILYQQSVRFFIKAPVKSP